MQSCDTKLQFEFNNSTDALVTSLQYLLGYITTNMPPDVDTEDILFRCKVIITELLTNAIKHGGESSTLFDIEIKPKNISLQKTDHGTPLYLVNNHTHPTSDSQNENRKLISADPMNLLYACWENENAIRFISEESSIEDFLSVEQVMEHFGILIITRASDEFTYTYHKDTSSNIFKVRINL